MLDRMASLIVKHRDLLLDGRADYNNPLAASADLVELIKQINKVDGAIAGLATVPEGEPAARGSVPASAATTKPASTHAAERQLNPFERFVRLVSANRMEQASQELSKTLQMSHDNMITATRFFARAIKTDASLADQLPRLFEQIHTLPEAKSMRVLVRTFGFQAVESRAAVQALRAITKPTGESAIHDLIADLIPELS